MHNRRNRAGGGAGAIAVDYFDRLYLLDRLAPARSGKKGGVIERKNGHPGPMVQTLRTGTVRDNSVDPTPKQQATCNMIMPTTP
jgi:hypothetical protein